MAIAMGFSGNTGTTTWQVLPAGEDFPDGILMVRDKSCQGITCLGSLRAVPLRRARAASPVGAAACPLFPVSGLRYNQADRSTGLPDADRCSKAVVGRNDL